jgi:hypothetical protein
MSDERTTDELWAALLNCVTTAPNSYWHQGRGAWAELRRRLDEAETRWQEAEHPFDASEFKAMQARIEELERERDGDAYYQMWLDENAALIEAREALRRIANRYCLHTNGDAQADSACLHKPLHDRCSICVARAALGEDT